MSPKIEVDTVFFWGERVPTAAVWLILPAIDYKKSFLLLDTRPYFH